MKYGTSKLIGANQDACIKVTFENGIDSPTINIVGLHIDGGGSYCGGRVCTLEAIANIFIDKCEEMKGPGSAVINHLVNFDGDKK